MKLFDYITYEDYGKEWYLQILSHYPKFALIDCVVQWDEFPATEMFPFLLISFGAHSVFGFSFRYKAFEIRMDFFQSRPRNLQGYLKNREV